MKNMIYIRNSLIIILCFTVICMGIGFIVLSVELKKERDKDSSFQVVFSSIEKTSSVKGSSVNPVGKVDIQNGGLSLNMEFQLNAVHDELTYVATIHNSGTIPALIVGLLESPNYSEDRFQKLIFPVTVTVSDIEGKIIPPGEDLSFKIMVYYAPSGKESVSRVVPYRIGLLTKSYS